MKMKNEGLFWLIGASLLTLGLTVMLCLSTARASDFYIEAGPTFISSQNAGAITAVMTQRFGDNGYGFSVGHIGDMSFETCPRPDCAFTTTRQLMVGVDKYWRISESSLSEQWLFLNKFEFGLGVYLFENKTRVSTALLHLRPTIAFYLDKQEHWYLKISHFSNAGAGSIEKLQLREPVDNCIRAFPAHKNCEIPPLEYIRDDANLGYDSYPMLGYRVRF